MLTFDVEDFINLNAVYALKRLLEILQKYNLKALFFITGHMAEKLSNYPKIIDLLKTHEIGYHSSSHSVRPLIPEFTDLKSYEKAYEVSLQRETSHINPITGKPEKEGGIYILQDLFHPKKIQAFRAPGMCWTPPHLEALHSLGIKYDFSTSLTYSEPIFYKELTFYPHTVTQQWNGTAYDYECLFFSMLRNRITIFDLHPTLLVNKTEWDSIYYKGNPETLITVQQRSKEERELIFQKLELLMKRIKDLQKAKIIDTSVTFNIPSKKLTITKEKIDYCYQTSIRWAVNRFHYYPRFVKNHFHMFFQDACQ